MAKFYYVTVPYCCSVNVLVTTDDEIVNADDAMDAAMTELDNHNACLKFINDNGDEVDRDKIDIGGGDFLKRIVSGNCMNASCDEICWEETDG